MKRKLSLIGISSVLIFVLLIIVLLINTDRDKKSELYVKYRYPNEEFFGEELYCEIDYKCSDFESEIGHMLIDKAIRVAEYTGSEQEADKEMGDVGALSDYYLFKLRGAVSQEMTFRFITCKIDEDEGHVWVVCTRIKYEESGKGINVGSNILTLWDIEYQDGEWRVVESREAP